MEAPNDPLPREGDVMERIATTRAQRQRLKTENKKWPAVLQPVPKSQWPPRRTDARAPVEVWRSREFLVQVYDEDSGVERLTVCRTSVHDGQWADQIPWDTLHALKSQCGRADKAAVEIYPPDGSVVLAANMRHLWVLPEPPPFMWGRK